MYFDIKINKQNPNKLQPTGSTRRPHNMRILINTFFLKLFRY